VAYDYIPFIIIVSPTHEHNPLWKLNPQTQEDLQSAVSAVADIIFTEFQLFPNFFTGGNIANAKYGVTGVHAHVHIEPRTAEDPEYNTFPGHRNKRMLSEAELAELKAKWQALLKL
jgi:diadenosine tetraphosphate (Ap4A) HIT family hydrolase